jgi:histidinol dehydrogenase
MTALTARLAGVTRVVVCSPPLVDGTVSPLVAAASKICNVDEVYKIGGAQAIAAIAYGTQSVKPVDKIVGPGGPFVSAAKQIVSSDVGTDMPAGPTELLVIAAGRFNERFVARDLIAQAEHSQWSICGVVTDSARNVKGIIGALFSLLREQPPDSSAAQALKRSLFLCKARNLKDAAAFANAFAPEHVQLLGRATRISKKITNCGLLLEGDYSPSAVSDYSVGSNHVLPTGGLAKSYSGLSAWDFMRRMETVRCTRVGLRSIGWPAILLARAEGFDSHARAILERLEN